ncbi:MAG: ABC transporter permease [Myxococcales bacterium]|nr:ABC transporter permease [Myxococcales bacterium]
MGASVGTEQSPEVRGRPGGLVRGLGQSALEGSRFWFGCVRMVLFALRALAAPGAAARRAVLRVTMAQIYFTGAEGLPFVTATALVVGATIMIQVHVAAPGMPGEIVGNVLVTVVLRELAPLVTAIIVASRSGTAIATELGNMKASLEFVGLVSLGIDPVRFVVLPRLIAVTASVVVLEVYFGLLALVGSAVVALAFGTPDLVALQDGLAATLRLADLGLFAVKGVGCGALVAVLSCYFGFQVKASSTEVPRMTGMAVIRSVLGCVIYNFLVTVVFYALFPELSRPV